MAPNRFDQFTQSPIQFDYPPPTPNVLSELRADTQDVVKVKESSFLKADNRYFREGLAGASSDMYTRPTVWRRLSEIGKILQPDFGLVLFDTYRSQETQRALFDRIKSQVRKENPAWSNEEIIQRARKYASNPDEKGRFPILPHNSGGAVDLTLSHNGIQLDMGTDHDGVSEISRTDYFEGKFNNDIGVTSQAWNEIRNNRRLLFNVMKKFGFTNYEEEWWHYDLGNCIWAQIHHLKDYYPSMEAIVR